MSRTFLLSLLVFLSVSTFAQKNIIISNELAANSEMLHVKMGIQNFGKIFHFRFGDYEVVKSKMGWTTTKSKSNIWGTKTESLSSEKFSFVLSNKSGDEAVVNAANKIDAKSLNQLMIFPNFSWGTNELLKGESLFSANIVADHDTLDNWVLFVKKTEGTRTQQGFLAFLTNGKRDIKIYQVSSNSEKENKSFPALGYEFVENDKPVSAVQYMGSGVLGTNKSIIWLTKNSDERMKLILASAMTAILQIETNNLTKNM